MFCLLQLLREALSEAPTLAGDEDTDEESSISELSMFHEASSSKTDLSEAQSSQTTSESYQASQGLDFHIGRPVVNCEECKEKAIKLKNMGRRLKRRENKLLRQKRKLTSQANVSSTFLLLLITPCAYL